VPIGGFCFGYKGQGAEGNETFPSEWKVSIRIFFFFFFFGLYYTKLATSRGGNWVGM